MNIKKLQEIKEANFNDYVYAKDGISLLFIYLEGDKYSIDAEELLEQLNREYEGDLEVFKLNGEENPMLIKGFMIRALPSLILFSNGRLMDIKTGVGTYESLLKFINRTLLLDK